MSNRPVPPPSHKFLNSSLNPLHDDPDAVELMRRVNALPNEENSNWFWRFCDWIRNFFSGIFIRSSCDPFSNDTSAENKHLHKLAGQKRKIKFLNSRCLQLEGEVGTMVSLNHKLVEENKRLDNIINSQEDTIQNLKMFQLKQDSVVLRLKQERRDLNQQSKNQMNTIIQLQDELDRLKSKLN